METVYPLQDLTLGQILDRTVEKYPDNDDDLTVSPNTENVGPPELFVIA